MVLRYPSRIAQRHSSAVNGTTSGAGFWYIDNVFINIEMAATIVMTDVTAIMSLELLQQNNTDVQGAIIEDRTVSLRSKRKPMKQTSTKHIPCQHQLLLIGFLT